MANRDLIIALAARYGVPTIYFDRFFAESGGLIAYSADFAEEFRQAAGYIDRILKGAKPADLPVQAPTKYELVINLKAAKSLGLNVPDRAARGRRPGDRIRLAIFGCGAKPFSYSGWRRHSRSGARAQHTDRVRRIGVLTG